MIVCDLRRDVFHLLTKEIQFRIRETDLFARQIQEFLFYRFDGIIGVDFFWKKHDFQFIFDNRLDFIFTKYCSEEWILALGQRRR